MVVAGLQALLGGLSSLQIYLRQAGKVFGRARTGQYRLGMLVLRNDGLNANPIMAIIDLRLLLMVPSGFQLF